MREIKHYKRVLVYFIEELFVATLNCTFLNSFRIISTIINYDYDNINKKNSV